MSDFRDPRARLLAETFHDDWAGGPAGAFARAAAAHARHRRMARRTLAATGLAATLAAVAFVVGRPPPPFPTPRLPVAAKPAYEIISDEELLAQLPGLPVLIQPDNRGGRRVTLLEPSAE